MFLRPRLRPAFILLGLFLTGFLFFTIQYQYQLRNLLSYGTRPLWDTREGPQKIVPHYYTEGMKIDSGICQLHGWSQRPQQVKVMDAVLMSSELDLLEIRMNELDSVVDRFFILESNATFTGLPKETFFGNNRGRFARFEHKISYHFMPGFPLKPGQEAFDVERETRDTMTAFLNTQISQLFPATQPLVIMADIDEIPSEHTIRLLKACNFGDSIHLQLRNYIYSFEWFLDFNSWRSSVRQWRVGAFDVMYRHSNYAPFMLADAGWHCSYCFRTLPEYVTKMQGFSHSDRIGGRIDLLEPKRIQDVICKGQDIFGMLPEAYSYVEMLAHMNPSPQTTAVGLPRYLLENAKNFKFLLPGGCLRDS